MDSWVYVLSRFTPEALFLEALLLFVLLSGYSAFWILRKRRFGIQEKALPSGAVRAYLNELIGNAESLRTQLFGLISASENSNAQLSQSIAAALQGGAAQNAAASAAAQLSAALQSGAVSSGDPALPQKLTQLEAKMAEQAKAIETITQEKVKLVEELTQAKAAASAQGGGGPVLGPDGQVSAAPMSAGSQAQIDELNKKIADLEARLAEYNVIEDDLANLKRLQQENTQLKQLLAEKGGSLEQLSAAAAATPASTPAPQASAPTTPTAEPTPAAEPEIPAVAEPAAPVAPSASEQMLAAAPGGTTDVAPTTPPAAEAAAAGAAPVQAGQITAAEPSEADLVAEFEKMLKG